LHWLRKHGNHHQSKIINQKSKMKRRNFVLSMAILAFMYFVFGFVSWVNSILIPYFKIICELNEFWAYFVDFAFYIAYLVMSVPAGFLLKKIGFKRGIMTGFFILATGACIFVPAAMTRTYEIFLIGLFTMGTGLSILQTAANPYVTIIGPIDRTVQRMSICGVFNKFAGIVSPLIFAALILKASDADLFKALPTMPEVARIAALDELAHRMMIPYACLGALLFGFGLFIRYSVLPEINTENESKEVAASHGGKTSVLQFPYLVLGFFAIFTHVGTQVIAITTIIRYAQSMGLNLLEAKVFAPFTLTATMIGYLVGIICIPRFLSQTNALRVCTMTGLILSVCILLVPGEMMFKGHVLSISIWFVALLGLPNALIYAGIWPLAIRDLGRFTKVGASILVMGLCGNAILPLIYGHYADAIGMRFAYWVLLPCFVYLVFYAAYGHKITSWKRK
jgi:glucose/galactose transporter